ncbi:hypothetical protein B0H63DRAFT_489536 [Podospora didyma]|uniref:Extracellular membrane protein CFEM domain-containing protein n=1 Tax=Podospora didyma TaxID=330526 RepID=A0AAE0N2B2_9PEZI|nr:hypothetical protein B0H63DRAFT_489536 [Podospora didyma]
MYLPAFSWKLFTAVALSTMVNCQAIPLITPPAALEARQVNVEPASRTGDCISSVVEFAACLGNSSSRGGNCLTETRPQGVQTCGCREVTAMYDCYTSFCSAGKAYPTYYSAVSLCAASGYGTTPPTPTGAAASVWAAATAAGNNDKTSAASPALQLGELRFWMLGFILIVGVGTFVGLAF